MRSTSPRKNPTENFSLRLQDRDRRLVGKIRQALKRMDEVSTEFALPVVRLSPNAG